MSSLIKDHHNQYFRVSPLYAGFSLLTSILLAALMVMALVMSAH